MSNTFKHSMTTVSTCLACLSPFYSLFLDLSRYNLLTSWITACLQLYASLSLKKNIYIYTIDIPPSVSMYVSCANLYENVHACIYIHIGWCTLKIHLLLETSCLMECSNVPCTSQEMTKSSSICFLIKIEKRKKK